jgi:L-2,4-diaminobutyric acid acetyltransferase
MPNNTLIFEFRTPKSTDGQAVHNLIKRCPPLDPNSLYCNLLQCSYFRDSSITVEHKGEIAGFISGFVTHNKPEILFVWQVAVDTKYRGLGLAKKMILELVKRKGLENIRYIETTITPDNTSSWQLFKSVSVALETKLNSKTLFDQETHFNNQHASEQLVKIGPFNTRDTQPKQPEEVKS